MRIPFVSAPLFLIASAMLLTSFVSADPQPGDRISVTVNEQQHRVDISVDGQPFTSYIWPSKLAKPVLYPLRTAKGTIVTRGFPLEQRPGERVDHPHHAGLWLNYESVNGIDFWNNSEAIKPQDAPKMGTIQQRSIVSQGEKVVFADAKDGMLGLRVVRALEAPSDKAEVFTDASGRDTTVAKLDNTGVNGVYLTSEGKKGDAAWGTRGRWCNLSGKTGDEPVTVSILDHPSNPGFPTYWHARGYGLFAANPLGQKVFSNGKEELNLTLEPNQSVTFRYRILITSEIATPESTEAAYKAFVAAYH
ncbi:MAG: hypothetical protein DMG36_15150 [Acidobacteria bacterium]|nr:MAG: hypothetical protein DMG36_15150 [Acidobacteriota bacterium]